MLALGAQLWGQHLNCGFQNGLWTAGGGQGRVGPACTGSSEECCEPAFGPALRADRERGNGRVRQPGFPGSMEPERKENWANLAKGSSQAPWDRRPVPVGLPIGLHQGKGAAVGCAGGGGGVGNAPVLPFVWKSSAQRMRPVNCMTK